jgi:hypothetical protein
MPPKLEGECSFEDKPVSEWTPGYSIEKSLQPITVQDNLKILSPRSAKVQ